MAGELLKTVTERQDATAREFDRLTEEMEQLAQESFFKWHGDHVYRFKYERVSPLFVRVDLWRDDKPVATAWIMYHTDRNQFAFSECEPSGDWPSMGFTCGLNKTLPGIADWLLLKIDAEERLGDEERLWSAACAALGKDTGKAEA